MKYIYLILFFICSSNVFSQIDEKLTGAWLKEPSKRKGLEFMKNGDLELYSPEKSNKRQFLLM